MKVRSTGTVSGCWISSFSRAAKIAAWSSNFGVVRAFIEAIRAFPSTKATWVLVLSFKLNLARRKATVEKTS